MSQKERLTNLLRAIADGRISPETALEEIEHLPFAAVEDFAKIDLHRQRRTGFPEVIWGADKTTQQIIKIITAMRNKASVVMATRIEADVYEG